MLTRAARQQGQNPIFMENLDSLLRRELLKRGFNKLEVGVNVDIRQEIKKVLDIEAQEILNLKERVDDNFEAAVEALFNTSGKVIVSGVGKSGHVGRKISSTLSSTGTPSFYIHPTESSHGDLGVFNENDLLIAISYSGETFELNDLIAFSKRRGIQIIAMVGKADSSLAKMADFVLPTTVSQEACPMKLAPTSSSTVTLALGDALAMAVLQRRGFQEHNFAEFHPGGKLGRRLLTKVKDVMHSGDALPLVQQDTPITEVIGKMTGISVKGVAGVTNENNQLVGIITDGDIRRHLLKPDATISGGADVLMSNSPITIDQNELAQVALQLMEQHKVNVLFATTSKDENTIPVGVITIQDLISAKIK